MGSIATITSQSAFNCVWLVVSTLKLAFLLLGSMMLVVILNADEGLASLVSVALVLFYYVDNLSLLGESMPWTLYFVGEIPVLLDYPSIN